MSDRIARDEQVVRSTLTITRTHHHGQCLRDAEVGDELLLVSHDPFTADTPHRSASPIFLHRDPCVPPEDLHELPTQLTAQQLSVGSFDPDEVMIDATVIDGHHLQATIGLFFTAQQSHSINVHNATRGCWAVAIGRVRLFEGDPHTQPSTSTMPTP